MEDIRNMFLEPDYYFGFRMKFGSVIRRLYWQIKEWEFTQYKFALATALAVQTASGWTEIMESSGSKYVLEPSVQQVMHQVFWGVNPHNLRIWRRYADKPVGDLKATSDSPAVATKGGFIRGLESPLTIPSRVTETLHMKDLHVSYNAVNMNATGGSTQNVNMNFYIGIMLVEPVTDKGLIRDFDRGKRRVHPFTVGSVASPAEAPSWLNDIYVAHYQGVA